jgi:hypothetical protein
MLSQGIETYSDLLESLSSVSKLKWFFSALEFYFLKSVMVL